MKGNMAAMELRSGWKGIAIFGILIIIISVGMPQIFPAFQDSLTEDLEGANHVHIDIPVEQGALINLSWDPLVNATSYVVLEDNSSFMLTSQIKYIGTATNISFSMNFSEKRYYAVLAMYNNTSQRQLIGITATGKQSNPFDELLENPAYSGFTGGRDINMAEVDGFLVLEFFSWWWMLAGLFIAYLSVAVIAGDFENKRMDLLFSSPISRRRYITEKYVAMIIIACIIVLCAILGLIAGLSSINALDEVPAGNVVLSLVACLPFLLSIAGIGVVTSVALQKVKAGIGATFAVIFAQFFMYSFGSYSPSLAWMKTLSIFTYWDYAAGFVDGAFRLLDFVVLSVLSVVLLLIAIVIFQSRDIPV